MNGFGPFTSVRISGFLTLMFFATIHLVPYVTASQALNVVKGREAVSILELEIASGCALAMTCQEGE
jgi:hypothetical protein